MKEATTLTTRSFEMMYYETRGVYCRPAEKFLSYDEFKKIFEPIMLDTGDANAVATAVFNKAVANGAAEEAALHAALFVFRFSKGKQAASEWFNNLVASLTVKESKGSDESVTAESDKSDEVLVESNQEQWAEITPLLKTAFEDAYIFADTVMYYEYTKDNDFMPIINKYRINSAKAFKAVAKKAKEVVLPEAPIISTLCDAMIAAIDDNDDDGILIVRDVIACYNTANGDYAAMLERAFDILKKYILKSKSDSDDPKDPDPASPPSSAAVAVSEDEEKTAEPITATPVVNNNINIVREFLGLKSLTDELYDTHELQAIKDKSSMILSKMHGIADRINAKPENGISTEEYHIFQYITHLTDVVDAINKSGDSMQLHLAIPVSFDTFIEADDKNLAIKNVAKIISNPPRSEIRSPIENIVADLSEDKPDQGIPEAWLLDGKKLSDNDLIKILKDKVNVIPGRKVSRDSINMLLNLIMNNQDEFVTKLIGLGAKTPLEVKEVKADKYTTDKKRFDVVFEVATSNPNSPIVFFYHWEPIPNKEGTAWSYDALVLPFDKVTLTRDRKKAKDKTKKQKQKAKEERPVPVQPVMATAK